MFCKNTHTWLWGTSCVCIWQARCACVPVLHTRSGSVTDSRSPSKDPSLSSQSLRSNEDTHTSKFLQPKVGVGKHLIDSSDRKGNQSSKNLGVPWSGGIWKWGLGEGRGGAGLERQVTDRSQGDAEEGRGCVWKKGVWEPQEGWCLGKPRSYFIRMIWVPLSFRGRLLENGEPL